MICASAHELLSGDTNLIVALGPSTWWFEGDDGECIVSRLLISNFGLETFNTDPAVMHIASPFGMKERASSRLLNSAAACP